MILSYITDTYSVKPAVIITEPETLSEALPLPEINISAEGNGNSEIVNGVKDNASYEMKYKLLMQKIEKERFERELIADIR